MTYSRHIIRLCLALVLGSVCLEAVAGSEPATATPLPAWQAIELEQKAFWATARSRVAVDRAPEELPHLWRLSASSSVVGNSENVVVDLDPDSGATRHRSRLSRGKDQRFKSFDYGADGILRQRHSPGEDATAAPQDWPVTSRKDIPYPLQGDERPVVTDAYTLLLLADRLQASDATSAEVVVHTEFNFYRVRMTCGNGIPVPVNYQIAGGKTVMDKRETRAVALQITELGTPVDKPDFSLLGLHSDIILFFDRESGLLVQVRGVAPRIGATQINLKTVTMREPPP